MHICRYQKTTILRTPKKMATLVEGDQKAPFSIATTRRYGEDAIPFPALLFFTIDPYLMMLSVKQIGIKNHFFFF